MARILPVLLLAACSAPAEFRVLSWNVLVSNADHADTCRVIRELRADVVCLQEVTPGLEAALRERLTQAYPAMEFAPDLAVLSNRAVAAVRTIPHPDGGRGALWIRRDDGVEILNVHLTSPPILSGTIAERLDAYVRTSAVREREMRGFLESIKPRIVAGDFNSLTSEPLHRFLIEGGWRESESDDPTWRHAGLSARIDFVYASPPFEPGTAEAVHDGRSDHWPVLATLRRCQ